MIDLAARYARAFAEAAASSGVDTAAAQAQLHDFADTLDGSSELHEFLMNPSIEMPQKLKVLDAIAKRIGMFPAVRNFVAVITEHQRLSVLTDILCEYRELADEVSGAAEAIVTTARPMDPADQALLEAQIAKLAGAHVRASYIEDPGVLGGAVVRIGSTIYDGSLRGQLQQMKLRLASA
jgi:F-type H+-transporting ATPase subunit delta